MDLPEQLKQAMDQITALREENSRLRDECARAAAIIAQTDRRAEVDAARLSRDIIEYKRTEEARQMNESRLETLLQLNTMTESSLHEIAQFTMEEGVKLTGSSIGYLAFTSDNEQQLDMYAWSKHALEECRIYDKPLEYRTATTGLWGEAVRQRKPIITNYYEGPSPMKRGYPEGHVPIKRHMNVPLFDGTQIVAVLGVGNKEEEYTDADVRQLVLLGTGMWRIIERQHAEETIKRERAYLASAIDLLPFPILFISKSQEIIRRNRSGAELLRNADDDLWQGIELLNPQTRMALPRRDWPMMRVLNEKTIASTEWILVLADKREIPILLQGAPIYIGDEFIGAVLAFQDISALKEIDRAKDQFLMVLSHEIKTPLTSIIGWTQLAQSAPDLVPEALSAILRNAYKQKVMLERLLILSYLLTGKLTLKREPVDIRHLLEQTTNYYRSAAQERHITLTLEFPKKELPPIMADEKMLTQAIGEMLDNAVSFAEEGGRVTVSAQQTADTIQLLIADTGLGIPAEEIDNLLKPFQQLQREEIKGGMGIGLALAHGIIEAHEGALLISSPGPGQGTIVCINLPISYTE